jgi:transcriptional regulator with XRE-family HTH domain
MNTNRPDGASSHAHDRWTLLRCLLVKARQDARLSQRTLAKKLGRPQSFVSRYERGGRKLDVAEFMHVCTVIGCDAAAILRTVSKGDAPA